jgi:catechol 2,3-dioxygenase-like lactoylglutathione lyase family enzyme
MAPRGDDPHGVFISGTQREAAMQVTGLFHVAIKTNDLNATVKFYTDVLGMTLAHRPDFGFPGAWISTGEGVPIIHIYAGGPALGADGNTPYGTSALDHVSLTIKGWDECLERIQRLGYDWRAAIVPGMSLWQIFVHDPSGVMMELTFDGKVENRPTPEIPPERVYQAGVSFGNVRQKAA